MTSSSTTTEYIVEKLGDISGVMEDDIHVSDDTVTVYVPTDRLEDAQKLEDINVKVLEEHEHEYLISAKPPQ